MSQIKIVTEDRKVTKFDSINLKGMGNVTVKIGKTPSCKVKADENVLPKIRTDVRNDTLIVSIKKFLPMWFTIKPTIEIEVTTESLKDINVSGIGEVKSDDIIKADVLTLENSGMGNIRLIVESKDIESKIFGMGNILLKGKTDNHKIVLTGAGKLNASEMDSKNVDVKSKGSGECFVNVKDKMTVNLSGLGKVIYKGKPEVASKITGMGNLEEMD